MGGLAAVCLFEWLGSETSAPRRREGSAVLGKGMVAAVGDGMPAGSHDAAEMIAAMYSFMATCKKNGVDEFEWLTDVFDRIQSHNHKDLYQLLPNNWAQYRP